MKLLKKIKEEIKFLFSILSGEAKLKVPIKDLIKDIHKPIKEYFWVFLIAFAFFIVGWYLASQYYSYKCSELMYETAINNYPYFKPNFTLIS